MRKKFDGNNNKLRYKIKIRDHDDRVVDDDDDDDDTLDDKTL